MEEKVTQKLHPRNEPTSALHVGVIIDNFKIIVVKILLLKKIESKICRSDSILVNV